MFFRFSVIPVFPVIPVIPANPANPAFFFFLGHTKTFIQKPKTMESKHKCRLCSNYYWLNVTLLQWLRSQLLVHHHLLVDDCLERLDRWLWEVGPHTFYGYFAIFWPEGICCSESFCTFFGPEVYGARRAFMVILYYTLLFLV